MNLKRWSKEDIELLRKEYPFRLNNEISEIINRSVMAISYMAGKLGLKKDEEFYCTSRKHTDIVFSKELLYNFYWNEKLSMRKIAGKMGVGKTTIEHYFKKYGIKRRSHTEASRERFKGENVWCKGLTKDTDERIRIRSEKIKKMWTERKKEKWGIIEKKFRMPLPEILYDFYWKKGLSQEKIAKKLKMDRRIIIRLMRKFGIEKRVNYLKISKMKGKNHPLYGKTWDDTYGSRASEMRKLMSIRSRKSIIEKITSHKIPFVGTSIERLLAKEMHEKKLPFEEQFNMDDKFVFDFAIPKSRLLIECDGDYWHANPKIYERSNMENLDKRQRMNIVRDKVKDKYAKDRGWYVLRFFESEIKKNPTKCVNRIVKFIQTF